MTTITSFKTEIRLLALLAAATVAVIAMPVFAHAQTYAYVNQLGEVNTVEASEAMTAISIAPNIDEHSGVIILGSLSDSIVGDDVQVQ